LSARFRQQRQLPGLRFDLGLVGEVGRIDAGKAMVREFRIGGVAAGFAQASPEALFPGAGGMPVSAGGVAGAGGVVVAGIAASGATVSPFFPDGVDPRVVSADGRPANPEDLLIAYALGVPYTGQHGDDQKRWEQCFGDLAVDPADSLGMAPAPPAGRQAQLDWARGLCDAAMDAATRRGVVAMFAVEFALIGSVAGTVGTVGGAVLAWAVLTRGMQIAWTWRPLMLAGAPLATVALSVVAGIAASAGALRRRPIEVLRAE